MLIEHRDFDNFFNLFVIIKIKVKINPGKTKKFHTEIF